MKPLPQNYDHKTTEKKWQEYWEAHQVYRWDETQPRSNTYVIDTPPPTVSGLLHMGHIFSYTQADFVARFQRMCGKTVFYPMGFDDNGLPTERLVEKVKKVRATDMSREEFIKLCVGVSDEARTEFRALFTEIALSVDWNQEYHTISEDSRRISQLSFLDLYNKDQAYRKLQPMLWDPVDQTAIAQAEVEDKEFESSMNYITFGVEEIKPSEQESPLPSGGDGSSLSRLRERVGVRAKNTWHTPKTLIEKARSLRKNSTDVERILWFCLRDRQLEGYKFRRQYSVPPYTADFVCIETKLIIELDGGQHAENAKDIKRTSFLEKEGFEVLRFWNNEVLENLEGVLETILQKLSEISPHPNPLPQAGEGTTADSILHEAEASDTVTIATTRPELLAACVAVFYHPDDERYQHLEGKTAITALYGVKVPFLADENVKMDKGTGLVMCCTFGDETDIEWWRTHNLPIRLLLNKYGKIDSFDISDVPCLNPTHFQEHLEKIQGLKAKDARAKNIELLQEAGLLVKQEPITHAVKCAERSGAPLEILPTNQWFIKVLDHKEALKAKAAECTWYPPYMKVRMDQWIDGLSWDWCVSRQRYFGVPFPIWYSKRAGEEGKIILADKDQLPVNPLVDLPKGYTREEVEGEADVMDTWATSSVSPQLSSKAINQTYAVDYARHQKLFPADLRPQAHEIIRTWAFYTLVKAHLHEDTIPWKNLMISGWCLASDKTKMSKSKGNVVTPVALIEEKGSDVVRYWASTSRLGADTAYSEDVLKIGKKLTNKLWNASKFAALHLDKIQGKPVSAQDDVAKGIIYETLDLWILTRLQRAITKATAEFDKYEYCNARIAAEDFFWNDFCDNYLELVKTRAYDEAASNPKGQQSAVHTIYHCLDGLLRLFAPFVPHITDELYSHIFDVTTSIHARGTWPEAKNYPVHEQAEQAGIAAVSILNAVRKLKAAKNVSVKWPLDEIAVTSPAKDNKAVWEMVAPLLGDLKNVTNAAEIHWKDALPAANDAMMQTETDDGLFSVAAMFAEKSDAA